MKKMNFSNSFDTLKKITEFYKNFKYKLFSCIKYLTCFNFIYLTIYTKLLYTNIYAYILNLRGHQDIKFHTDQFLMRLHTCAKFKKKFFAELNQWCYNSKDGKLRLYTWPPAYYISPVNCRSLVVWCSQLEGRTGILNLTPCLHTICIS